MTNRSRRATRAGALALVGLLAAVAPALAQSSEATVQLVGEPVGRVEILVDGVVHFVATTGAHDIVGDDGTWVTGFIAEGDTASLRFNQAGEYPFHCTIHPTETGTVVVTAQGGNPPPPANNPPSVAIATPADGATVRGTVLVTVQASDADAGPKPMSAEARVDGGNWVAMVAESSSVFSARWDTTDASEGPHTIEARVFDGADHSPVVAVTVTVENRPADPTPPTRPTTPTPPPPDPEPQDPPVVTVDTPQDGDTVRPADLLVLGTADAAPGLRPRVEVSIDGGEWRRARGAWEWTFLWPEAEMTEGAHTIAARAHDGARYSAVAEIQIVVSESDLSGPLESTPGPAFGGWKEAALNFGWVVIVAALVTAVWTWASSRP